MLLDDAKPNEGLASGSLSDRDVSQAATGTAPDDAVVSTIPNDERYASSLNGGGWVPA